MLNPNLESATRRKAAPDVGGLMRSFLNFAVGSLALTLFCGSALAQVTPKAGADQPASIAASNAATAPAATAPTSSTEASAPASTASPAPATNPASAPTAPPTVTYENGQLTVISNNATLSDILKAIQEKTGTAVDSAVGVSTDRVIGQYGPATPSSVIRQLLDETSLNYALVRPPDGAPIPKVLLSERPAHVDVQLADESRRGFGEAAADGGSAYSALQADFANVNFRSRRKRRFVGNTTDSASTDGTNGDGTQTAANTGIDGAAPIGTAIGSPILPDSVPANIMKAIQHTSAGGTNPASAGNSGMFGPNPGGSGPMGGTGGSTYTLPGGATMLGPAIQLPGGALFFPGGATGMPGR
jgi:hypothetical protein